MSESFTLLFLRYLQYHKSFSNWTILSITVADVDDLPARFSTFVYSAFIREDASMVRLMIKLGILTMFREMEKSLVVTKIMLQDTFVQLQ